MCDKQCKICGTSLNTEREIYVGVCYECRAYGLANGEWPTKKTVRPGNEESNEG